MSAGKVVLLIFGMLLIIGALVLGAAGACSIIADRTLRDSEGFFMIEQADIERDSYAIVSPTIRIDEETEDEFSLGDLATIKVEATNEDVNKEIFIGIAEQSHVEDFLLEVEYDEVTEINFTLGDDESEFELQNHPGSQEPLQPSSVDIWVAHVQGSGTQSLKWDIESGNYMFVIMNADASAGMSTDAKVGAKIPPIILWLGIALVVGAVIALVIGGILVYLAVRKPKATP